ncbi:MAG: cell division protein FtsZ, partial [Acidimicrobiales bacterium]
AEVIHEVAHPDANIIFGAVVDESMGSEVRVTVIAAGFDRWDDERDVQRPAMEARPLVKPDEPETRQVTPVSSRPEPARDVFATEADDAGEDDGDLDVPSFLQ